ncbi:hypothetical protein FIBSPDRAFT_871029 [Athelia psychrophila]|uniref:Uncharacterized protein n=1 Tax=Athelia psychrophila TaxID=1759441 RepID=A0A166AMG7_9AGAM|nr:hypothetical protein FIBSPDRAFT_871029 [Fibularhizoctonia sp. CBS 109695]
MQPFTLVLTPHSRLALAPILILVFALLSDRASAAPHPHLKRCNTVLYTEPCYGASDCCAFSYCQAQVQGDKSLLGVCMPSFSETPYMEIVSMTVL